VFFFWYIYLEVKKVTPVGCEGNDTLVRGFGYVLIEAWKSPRRGVQREYRIG
jgi:hypothetical protein